VDHELARSTGKDTTRAVTQELVNTERSVGECRGFGSQWSLSEGEKGELTELLELEDCVFDGVVMIAGSEDEAR
jgi:hypothetical protein